MIHRRRSLTDWLETARRRAINEANYAHLHAHINWKIERGRAETHRPPADVVAAIDEIYDAYVALDHALDRFTGITRRYLR